MRSKDQMLQETYIDDAGIRRWKSNSQVPPTECLVIMGIEGQDFADHRKAAERDMDEFATAYILRQAKRTPEQIAEQRAEARAAVGPGVKMVDVISGAEYTT